MIRASALLFKKREFRLHISTIEISSNLIDKKIRFDMGTIWKM